MQNLNHLNPFLEIYNGSGEDLEIRDNPQLLICDVPAICNYLNSGNAHNPIVSDNSGACVDLGALLTACSSGGSGGLQDIFWTGSVDDVWDNANNWSPAKVPDNTSKVIIPSGVSRYPKAYSDPVTIGGLRMTGSAELNMNGKNLNIGQSVYISDSEIKNLGGTITISNPVNPEIMYSTITAYKLAITDFTGELWFYRNDIDAEVSISDHASRNKSAYIFGNDFGWSLELDVNSNFGSFYLSNGVDAPDHIVQDLIINNKTNAPMFIGLGSDEPLFVGRDVKLSETFPNTLYLQRITFDNSLNGSYNVTTPGSAELEVEELFFRKMYESRLVLQAPIKVTGKLVMAAEMGSIKTETISMLTIGDACVLVDEDPITGTFVDGPMRKIGNTAFTFPIGHNPSLNTRQNSQTNEQTGLRRGPAMPVHKAPISMSAPADLTASFIAEYFKHSPVDDGYDTAFYASGTGIIQTGEYWKLTREAGASNVTVSLNYNDMRVQQPFTPEDLQITGWDGSKWTSWGNGGTTGSAQQGMVSSASPLTTYGPLALAIQDARAPVVTIAPFDSIVCMNTSRTVHFTLDTAAIPGNVFTLELSNEHGSFESGTTVLGTKTTSQSDSISFHVTTSLIRGNHYRIRIKGSQPGVVSVNTPTFIPQSRPQTTVSIEGPTEVCLTSGAVKYYPSAKEPGVTYNWTVTNGSFTVNQDTAFVTFATGGTGTIKLTPSTECGNGTVANKSVTITPAIPDAAPELVNMGRRLSVSTPPAEQMVTAYNWYRDGGLIAGAEQPSYIAEEAGTYTVAYKNHCGVGPVSNSRSFSAPAISQTITLPHQADLQMAPALKVKLNGSASSGLPVFYSIVKGKGTISNDSLIVNGAGQIVITAEQPGDDQYAPAPDLRVDSVFLPNTVFSGSAINIVYKVKNYGALNLPGSKWTDQAYISRNAQFDSATAIKLRSFTDQYGKPVQEAGFYYPYDVKAAQSQSLQLETDSSYTGVIHAYVPNFIFGDWYIHVKTNDKHELYEGPAMANNTNSRALQVYLTPTPHITVNSVTLPVTEASTTQPIGLNWVLKNTGSTDNIEMNMGHYLGRSTGNYPCIPPSNHSVPGRRMMGDGGAPDNPQGMWDSLGFGSSYWVDRIYISTDPGGLDVNNARLLLEYNNGTKQFSGIEFLRYVYGCGVGPETVNTSHALMPNRSFANSSAFTVPGDLQPGTYYLYVHTNATKTVFEYPGAPEIKRSGPLVIRRPDLVASLNAPATAVSGTPVEIEYTVSNNGPGGVFNHARVDQLYVSNHSVFDNSAELVSSVTHTENVLSGTSVTHTMPFTLHPSQSGTRYFFIKTNAAHSFAETDTSNNMSASAAIHFAVAQPVDLVVSQISLPDTVVAGKSFDLPYIITNNGTGVAEGVAIDSFFISCNPVFSKATAVYIGAKTQARNIEPGASAADTLRQNLPMTFQLSSCFPNDEFNDAYFFVKTNASGAIYEGSDSSNNVSSSGKKVVRNNLADLVVDSVSGAPSAIVGRPYHVSWTVKNVGGIPQTISSAKIADSIYISPDSVLNTNAVPFGGVVRSLDQWNRDRNLTKAFVNVPSGSYYVLVKTNVKLATGYEYKGERNFSNNVNLIRDELGRAKTVSVVRPPLPDLTDSLISYPTDASPGQPITVIHRIKNIGTGETYPNKFNIQMGLAIDVQGDRMEYALSSKEKTATIPAGGHIDDTIQVSLPTGVIPRIYNLVVHVDSRNDVVETDETNNKGVAFVNVFLPEPSDLVVTSVQAVDTVVLGDQIDSVHYIVQNISANPARGSTSDGIYLSTADKLDSTAVLIGVNKKQINMAPLASDTIAFRPVVSGVTEGLYNLFVHTDLTNAIPETNDTNNITLAASPVYVRVKELHFDETDSRRLRTNAYYKLVVPEALQGATIEVKLVSNDSLTRINQLFIGKEYIPDAAHFDYAYSTANYGNQAAIITYAIPGTYYINIRCVNPAAEQNIRVSARVMPFEIRSVQSSSGGNIGNVTVKIDSSLFTEGMTARLNGAGTQINASTVYFTNTTTIYATFNLAGKPLGVYDVTLSKADTSIATLSNGFSVVKPDNGGLITGSGPNTRAGDGSQPGCDPGAPSGLNSQLVTELIVPEKVLAGWPFQIQINFKNPTNYDVPAQVRTLYAEEFIKLGLSPESSASGPATLPLIISGTEGPPGIIRAGGSGTIILYGRAREDVPGHTFTIVTLK